MKEILKNKTKNILGMVENPPEVSGLVAQYRHDMERNGKPSAEMYRNLGDALRREGYLNRVSSPAFFRDGFTRWNGANALSDVILPINPLTRKEDFTYLRTGQQSILFQDVIKIVKRGMEASEKSLPGRIREGVTLGLLVDLPLAFTLPHTPGGLMSGLIPPAVCAGYMAVKGSNETEVKKLESLASRFKDKYIPFLSFGEQAIKDALR